MTHRQARRRLGSRKNRRVGTKTRIIPGRGDKQPPKYTMRRTFKGKESLASQVRKIVAASTNL